MAEYEESHEDSGSSSRFRGCMRFLWNPRTKEFLGRTGKSWGLIGLFYLIFYACLAGFFVAMLAIFLNCVIPEQTPRLTGMQSLLKLTPGISFFPIPNYKSTLVKFTVSKNDTWKKYLADINTRLKSHNDIVKKKGDLFAKCNLGLDTKIPNDPDKVCRFDPGDLGECTSAKEYGYPAGQPCIFIKLNKVYGWIPDVKKNISNPYIQCEGETPADKENIGPLEYFPPMTVNGNTYAKISNVFFPYLRQDSYVSPIAAIRFVKPVRNVLVMVKCTLMGLHGTSLNVRLELLVEGMAN